MRELGTFDVYRDYTPPTYATALQALQGAADGSYCLPLGRAWREEGDPPCVLHNTAQRPLLLSRIAVMHAHAPQFRRNGDKIPVAFKTGWISEFTLPPVYVFQSPLYLAEGDTIEAIFPLEDQGPAAALYGWWVQARLPC